MRRDSFSACIEPCHTRKAASFLRSLLQQFEARFDGKPDLASSLPWSLVALLLKPCQLGRDVRVLECSFVLEDTMTIGAIVQTLKMAEKR